MVNKVNVPASFWFWPWFGYMCMVLGENGFSLVEWWCWLLFFFCWRFICIYLFGYKMNWWFSFDQLPCRSSHFAVLVEHFVGICRHLCTSCQAIFKECPSCMYIYYRRWGESHLFSLPVKFWSIFGECWNGVDISTKRQCYISFFTCKRNYLIRELYS